MPPRPASPERQLHDAVQAGDVEALDAVVAAHPETPLVGRCREQMTPLERAVTRADARVVRRLMHHGALPFGGGDASRGAVAHAATCGHVENVEVLLSFGTAAYADLARVLDGPTAGTIPRDAVFPLIRLHGALPRPRGLRSLGSAHGADFVRDLMVLPRFVASPCAWGTAMERAIALDDAPLLLELTPQHSPWWWARAQRTCATPRERLSGGCAAAMLRAWYGDGECPARGLEEFAAGLNVFCHDPAARYLGNAVAELLAARRVREAGARPAPRPSLLDRVAALVLPDGELAPWGPAPDIETGHLVGGAAARRLPADAAALAADEASRWQLLIRQLDVAIHARPDEAIYSSKVEHFDSSWQALE